MFKFRQLWRPGLIRQSVTPIFAACIGVVFSPGFIPSANAEIQWSNKRVLPRVQSFTVPLKYRKYSIGEVGVRLFPSGKIEVQKDQVVSALTAGVKPKYIQILKQVPASQSGYISISSLKKIGFPFTFNKTEVTLFIHLAVDHLKERDIDLANRRKAVDSKNLVSPSQFSASLNMFFGADYISQNQSGHTGFSEQRVDLESSINVHGFVIENEATLESEDKTFGDSKGGFKRRGTRVVKDFVSRSIRAKAGDVAPGFTSFQSGRDLLGVSIEHNVSMLNPGRDIRATSRRSFRIERDSDVSIYVNGKLNQTRRLPAGHYNVSDLPGSAGANNVELVIQDDVGHRQVLRFTTFLDGKLLSPEISEWAVSAGVVALTDDGEPDYTSNPALSAYYRRGITERMTGEIHIQGDESVIMGGGGLLWGSSYGLINTEAAMSFAQGGGFGYAVKVDYSVASNLLNGSGHYNRSLNLSAEYRSGEFSAIGKDIVEDDTQLVLSLGYGQQLFWDINASLSANYTAEEDGNAYGANLNLSKRLTEYLDGGLSFGYRHDDNSGTGEEENEFSAALRFSYRLSDRSGISANYDAGEGNSNLNYNYSEGQGAGSWSASLSASHNPGDDKDDGSSSANGSLHYTGNRANYSASHNTQFAGLAGTMVENRTSLRMETAIAYAGGAFAIGRPVQGPFAIISPHDSIRGKSILVNPTEDGVMAYSDWMSTVLVPNLSEYATSRVTYDVDDLPVGYDLGAGAFDFKAPYKSGYALTVGSNYTVTAFGSMVDRKGEPVKLLTGIAWSKNNPSRKVTIFTNSAGRFGAQGLAPGDWTIEMATTPLSQYKLKVPEGTVGLLKVGVLKPAKQ